MAGGAACVHTRGGRAGRDAMRSAWSGWAGEGRPARAVPAVRVQAWRGDADTRSARSPGVRREGAMRASVRPALGAAGCVLTSAPAPGSAFPAGLSQRSRTGAKPGGRPQRHPCSIARRPRRRSAARAGGSVRPGRREGAAPQSGHAPRSLPRAPLRSPARPLPL